MIELSLGVDFTPMESIDLSKNVNLTGFNCGWQSGYLTKPDLSNNSDMQYLDIQFLPLSELDIRNCPKLVDIVENCERDEIGDRKAWDGDDEHEGQIQIPLKCKLIYK